MILGALAASLLMVFLVSTITAQNITDGLVLYLSFDEDGAAEIPDHSGNGNNAVISLGNPQWVTGVAGNALRFVPDRDALRVPFSETLVPENAMTIAVWVNFNGVDALPSEWGGVIIDDYLWNADGNLCKGYFLGIEQNNVRCCFLGDGTGEHCFVFPTHPVEGEWTHLAATWDGNELRGYMNGGPVNDKWTGQEAVAWVGTIGPNREEDVFIGAKEGSFQGYPGALDELVIYNRGLSADDIQLLVGGGLVTAVQPVGKLATTWGVLKTD